MVVVIDLDRPVWLRSETFSIERGGATYQTTVTELAPGSWQWTIDSAVHADAMGRLSPMKYSAIGDGDADSCEAAKAASVQALRTWLGTMQDAEARSHVDL